MVGRLLEEKQSSRDPARNVAKEVARSCPMEAAPTLIMDTKQSLRKEPKEKE